MPAEEGAVATIVEVTDETFVASVIEESKRRPVVVDFWAGWCQPCRIIAPVLEQLAEEHRGEFLLAKLDVDRNPQVSTAFRISSIPAVIAFRDGRPVNEFVGAIPEPQIRRFIDTIVPSEADRLTDRAREAEGAGRTEEAERLYREALAADASDAAATLGLARLAALRGDVEEARSLVLPLRPDPEAERLFAAIEISEWTGPDANGAGPLRSAERAAAEGRFQEALEVFLAAVRNGSDEDRQAARQDMLKVFSVLGEEDPVTVEYRRKLAAALF